MWRAQQMIAVISNYRGYKRKSIETQLPYFADSDAWEDFKDQTKEESTLGPHVESLLKGLDSTLLAKPFFAYSAIWSTGYLEELMDRLAFIYENGLPESFVNITTNKLPYPTEPILTIQRKLLYHQLPDYTPIWVYSNPVQTACRARVGDVLQEGDRGIFTHTNPFWLFWIKPTIKCRLDIKVRGDDIAYVVKNLSIEFALKNKEVIHLRTLILKPNLWFHVDRIEKIPLCVLDYKNLFMEMNDNYNKTLECLICSIVTDSSD